MSGSHLECYLLQRRDVIAGAAVGGVQKTFQNLKKLLSPELKLILAFDLPMHPLSRRTKATAFAEIFIYLCMSTRDNPVAVMRDLIVPFRKILFNFKCEPLGNSIQQLLLCLRLLGVQEVFKFSACVQVILNAIAFCPYDPSIV